jgi:deoxyribodipyrimidine photolyase-related protein
MVNPSPTRIILVLGDQLSPSIAALSHGDRNRDVVVMAEVRDEATYVPHHKRKIAFLFSAMRHFAETLQNHGWQVSYTQYDDAGNAGSLLGEVARVVDANAATEVIVTEPAEYRLKSALDDWHDALGVPVTCLDDDRFLADHAFFDAWAEGRKQLRMEYFYREMRRKTGLLMHGDAPEGGKWNFDAENRKPASANLFMPQPFDVEPDDITEDVLALVERAFPDNIGNLEGFNLAVTAADAEQALTHFVTEALAHFGDYQDAMLDGAPFLYHSVLSQYINAGLLDPMTVCRRVERAYYEGDVPINAAEGFIRQIIGWREFVRGIYWCEMPGYTNRNALGATRPLPAFYWTGQTKMACMSAAINQTIDLGYAHHIQRLMVTGNFAMLAGVDPHEVHEWYLAVYMDAYEWVEAPNVIGMSQFADGGLLGSKPYAAGGNYINKMSDYCKSCRYNVKEKTTKDACPFNALYWDFLTRNADKLRGNPRLGPVYRTWDRMQKDTQAAYRARAADVLAQLDAPDPQL